MSDGRGYRVDDDRLSGCCCVIFSGAVSGGGGYCTDLTGCLDRSAPPSDFTMAQCPGQTCQSDADCPTFTQFCTGGVCRMKAELGEQCAFSAGCGGGDDFNNPAYSITPACCCLTGGSTGVCSLQDACYRLSGGTCECSAPSQFGGVCPGSPCGQDSDCNHDYQFCTSGTCRPKQVSGTSCSFTSQCLGAPVGEGCCCSTDGTTGQCKDNHFRCDDIAGTCLP